MQMYESTDISNISTSCVYEIYLLIKYVRFFLFCQILNGRTSSNVIFSLINTFLCKAICIDGEPAFTRSKKCFTATINKIMPSTIFTHCTIHREAVAVKKIQPFVNKDVSLQNAISIVDLINTKAFNSRLFTIICIGYDHKTLLL